MFQLYHKDVVSKTVWQYHINRYWSMELRRESEINLHTYDQVIFDKDKRIYNKERVMSSINGVGNQISSYERAKLDPYFTSYATINSKWISG